MIAYLLVVLQYLRVQDFSSTARCRVHSLIAGSAPAHIKTPISSRVVAGSAPVYSEAFTTNNTVLLYVHKVLRIRTGIRTGGVKRHTSAFGINSSIFNLISFTSVVLESGRLSATSRITNIVIAVSQEFTISGAFSVNR